jgi:hypothetical protein
MEISRERALKCLNRWKDRNTLVGLFFAARGGTAGSTMLARISEVGARIVFKSDSAILRYALYQSRFEYGPMQVLLRPSRDGMATIDGLHVWLETGHWLFVCDGEGVAQNWLDATGLAAEPGKGCGLLKSESDREPALQEG